MTDEKALAMLGSWLWNTPIFAGPAGLGAPHLPDSTPLEQEYQWRSSPDRTINREEAAVLIDQFLHWHR